LTRRSHIRIFLIATAVWAGFWFAGLPSYYQQYPNVVMVWFELFLLIPIAVIVYVVLKPLQPDRRLKTALWMAFYFTVPLAVYDWLYCGMYLGHGIRFFIRYWYLTVYYAIPWILLPLTALFLGHQRAG